MADLLSARPVVTSECLGDDGVPRPASDLVLLDWDGGVSPLYPDAQLGPLDLAGFETPGGGALADRAEEFKRAVRQQVTQIYCDFPDADIRVEHRDDARRVNATVIHIAQALSPGGGAQIGEGEYDPCNRYHDDSAIIFGEQIRRLGGPYAFDEWVMMFANVTAHEIGHMLGYGHIERSEQPERALYVELMLTGHTIEELQRDQRFLVPQEACPKEVVATRCVKRTIHAAPLP